MEYYSINNRVVNNILLCQRQTYKFRKLRSLDYVFQVVSDLRNVCGSTANYS